MESNLKIQLPKKLRRGGGRLPAPAAQRSPPLARGDSDSGSHIASGSHIDISSDISLAASRAPPVRAQPAHQVGEDLGEEWLVARLHEAVQAARVNLQQLVRGLKTGINKRLSDEACRDSGAAILCQVRGLFTLPAVVRQAGTWQESTSARDMEGQVTVSAPPWMTSTRWRKLPRRALMSRVASTIAIALPADTIQSHITATHAQASQSVNQSVRKPLRQSVQGHRAWAGGTRGKPASASSAGSTEAGLHVEV